MLNVKQIIMTSYFQNGAKKCFFGILSNLARYRASKYDRYIKTGIYLLLYLIIFQNIKTELKNLFSFGRESSSK